MSAQGQDRRTRSHIAGGIVFLRHFHIIRARGFLCEGAVQMVVFDFSFFSTFTLLETVPTQQPLLLTAHSACTYAGYGCYMPDMDYAVHISYALFSAKWLSLTRSQLTFTSIRPTYAVACWCRVCCKSALAIFVEWRLFKPLAYLILFVSSYLSSIYGVRSM